MPFRVRCPNRECLRTTMVADEMRGRKARCKRCGTQFVLDPAGEAEPVLKPASPLSTPTPSDRPADIEAVPVPAHFVAPFSTLAAPALKVETEDEEVVAGRYRLGRVLGKGNFGLVYHAYDLHLERDVAIKILHPDAVSSAEAVSRFQREAKAAARLHHPHIVPVFDAGRHGDNYFLVAAYIEGRTVDKLIPPTGVEPRRAVTWTLQLLDALGAAHRQGVLHRDVKSGNIMIDAADRLHLMDFGLAGWTQGQDNARLTQAGAFMGTPAFTAPEQARGDTAAIGAWSDVYSAGVVFYQLLTGQVPFRGPLARVIYQVLEEPAPSPFTHKPDLDPELERICMRALVKEVSKRYQSCEEMAQALQHWLSNQPSGPTPLQSGKQTPLPATPQSSVATPRFAAQETQREIKRGKPLPLEDDGDRPNLAKAKASARWRAAAPPAPDKQTLSRRSGLWLIVVMGGLLVGALLTALIALAVMLLKH